jgi:hypothetical protein
MTDEKLNAMIEEASKNTSDFSVRNALMELRGLRAVIRRHDPAVMVLEDGTKLVIYREG